MGSLNPKVLLEIWDISYLPFGLGAIKMALGLGFLVGPIALRMIMVAFKDSGTSALFAAGSFYGAGSLLALVCFFINKTHE